MTSIETIICLILLFVGVPDLCRKILRRPALIYSVFVIFGIILAPFINANTEIMLMQAGKVGFLLLLFEVGLEIDLPRFRDILRPLRLTLLWVALQYPLILALATITGFTLPQALLAAAAFTGCSVGMAYHAWKNFHGFEASEKALVLQMMVLLEVIAILLLSMESVTLTSGFGWGAALKLLGIAAAILLVSRFANRVQDTLQLIVSTATHWRIHLVTLLVLGVCAVGERLGLSGAKTAFFLGLFMSRTRHDGMRLEDYIAPISQRLLIPIFFVAMGLQVDWRMIFSRIGLLALCSAFLLIGVRQALYQRIVASRKNDLAFLLFCPNLTMAALAADALLKHNVAPEVSAWILLTGLFVTIPSICLLPRTGVSPAPTPAPEKATEPAIESLDESLARN